MKYEIKIKKDLINFSLDVDIRSDADKISLFGASGSGKTLILKCIAGLIDIDSGRIVYNGRVFYDSEQKINLSPGERNLALFFPEYALFPNMTVYRHLYSAIRKERFNSYSKKEIENFIQDRLQLFGLEKLKDKLPYHLSSGEKQRLALARISCNDVSLVLLDEAFSALDTYLRWKMQEEVHQKMAELKQNCIFVSHNIDEVLAYADEVFVIDSGKVVEALTANQLFSSEYVSFYTAKLMGDKNFYQISLLENEIYEERYISLDQNFLDLFDEQKYEDILKMTVDEKTVVLPCTVNHLLLQKNRIICTLKVEKQSLSEAYKKQIQLEKQMLDFKVVNDRKQEEENLLLHINIDFSEIDAFLKNLNCRNLNELLLNSNEKTCLLRIKAEAWKCLS